MNKIILFFVFAFVICQNVNGQWQQTNGITHESVWPLATRGTELFTGTDGSGMFLSTNNGGSWNAINNGLSNLHVRSLVVNGSNIFVGTTGGIFLSINNGNSFTAVNSGLTDTVVFALTIKDSVILAGTQSGIFKSTNNGASWIISNNGLGLNSVRSLSVMGSIILAGTDGDGVYKSFDNGNNWIVANSGLPAVLVNSFVFIGTKIFIGTEYGIYLSSDTGNTWTATYSGLTHPFVWTIAHIGSTLFAGTDGGGVCYSTNNGLFWTPINGGLTNNYVFSFAVIGSKIFAGTYGDGVWDLSYSQSYPCVIGQLPSSLSVGLIAWYPFCGNANDETGNGHNGIVHGSTLTDDRFGNFNSAYLFNGFDNYIEVPDDSTLNITSDMSITCWYSSDNPPPSINGHTLVGKRFDNFTCCSPDIPYDLSINYTNSIDYRRYLFASGVGGIYTYSQPILQIDTNVWNHVAMTITGDSIKFYHNGIFIEQMYHPASSRTGNNMSLMLGGIARAFGDEYLKGKLDDVRIYNRPLDSAEVQALYNEGLCFQTITVTDTLIINANLTGFNPVIYRNSIKIYPNPAHDHIIIDNGSNFSTLSGYILRIDNSLGSTVYSTPITQQTFTVDMNTWTGNGVYFVYLIDASGHTIDVRKIVVQ